MNTPHPELEALAELADPAEPTSGADELLAHVEACERCKADVAALRGVRHSLRSLPPVAMPDDVAARLESAIRAAAQATPEPVGSVSVLPAREERTPGRRERWFPQFSAAAVVAVLVVVALGTGIGVMVSQSGGQTKGSASSGLSAAGSGSTPILLTSGTNYQQGSIRNQIAALVLTRVPQAPQQYKGLDSLAEAATAPSAAAGGSAPAAAPSPAASSAAASSAASAGSAPPAIPTTAGQAAGGFDSQHAPATRTAISGPLADPAALQACILQLVQKPETPVLVDYANYQGKPATIIVLADPTTPSTLDVYVEADTADCAKSGDVTFVTFLQTAS